MLNDSYLLIQDNCYTQGITKTRFSRMLHMVGLDVKPADLEVSEL